MNPNTPKITISKDSIIKINDSLTVVLGGTIQIKQRDWIYDTLTKNYFQVLRTYTDNCKKIIATVGTERLEGIPQIEFSNVAKEIYSAEDLISFLEFVRSNFTGIGAPNLVYNKGGQMKPKAIVDMFAQSIQPKQITEIVLEQEVRATMGNDLSTTVRQKVEFDRNNTTIKTLKIHDEQHNIINPLSIIYN